MPYKNIEDRRQAYKRWYERNKDKANKYKKILYASKKENPESQKCSISNCELLGERHHPDYSKPTEIVWLCKAHHEMIHHKEKRICSYENCEKKHWAKGLCLSHLKKWDKKKYG